MKRRDLLAVGIAIAVLGGTIHAADASNPTGTWRWSRKLNDKLAAALTLKLKYDDGKLDGKLTLPNGQDLTIHDSSFKNGEVAFSVTQDGPMQRKIVTKYKGKMDGDTIKGQVNSNRKGQLAPEDWEAIRDKP